MTDKPSREADFERVLAVADQISGDRQASLLWLRRPLKEFDDRTPENLILMGQVENVLAYLSSISSGFVG
jgi:uncharacterized protein (DUF2384 family)